MIELVEPKYSADDLARATAATFAASVATLPPGWKRKLTDGAGFIRYFIPGGTSYRDRLSVSANVAGVQLQVENDAAQITSTTLGQVVIVHAIAEANVVSIRAYLGAHARPLVDAEEGAAA